MRSVVVLLACLLGACAAERDLPPGRPNASGLSSAVAPVHTRAALIAADDSIGAFGNATRTLQSWLLQRGVERTHIQRVGGRGVPGSPATLKSVLGAIGNIQAGPADSCLVYVTGHGTPKQGIYVRASRTTIRPGELDRALARGCGARPTVVVLSGCFSGTYLDGNLPRDNRIIITAARRDRTSFGCSVAERYTYFDSCVLKALSDDRVATWEAVQSSARFCVATLEAEEDFTPSEPQMAVGRAVAGMRLPVRPSS